MSVNSLQTTLMMLARWLIVATILRLIECKIESGVLDTPLVSAL